MLETIVDQVLAHAHLTPDTEVCGLAVIVRGKLKYIPCTNELSGDTFSIPASEYISAEDSGEVVGVCHSHVFSDASASSSDIIACNNSKVPWLIVSVLTNTYSILQPKNTISSLVGREFYHGVQDCYSLARDYYSEVLNIRLPDFHRDVAWWDSNKDIISENFKSAGFVEVTEPRLHDGIIMQVASKVPNHISIYLGDNRILHHCMNRLSSRDWYDDRAQRATKLILRHKDLM